jgi:hypothetical protein
MCSAGGFDCLAAEVAFGGACHDLRHSLFGASAPFFNLQFYQDEKASVRSWD